MNKTTIQPDEPDCTRCNYTQGQIWRPNSQNCHLFYICERLPGSPLRYRVHVGTCGHLYWSQRQLTCVRKPDVNCVVRDVVTFKPSPIVPVAPCPYNVKPSNHRYFTHDILPGTYQDCGDGFNFDDDDEVCTCIPTSTLIKTACSDDLLLHFPFDVDFVDVTCHRAVGTVYGEGRVRLVYDSQRKEMVSEFDGAARVEVPFMINYFTDSRHTSWTVSLYFLVHDGNPSSFGLVDNGDCVENATYLVYGRATASGPAATVYGGIAAGSPRATNTPLQAVPTLNVWHHAAIVYDGSSLKQYFDKVLVSETPLTGYMRGTHSPMHIGMIGCCDEHMGYFKGRIDDLKIYTRALSASEIGAL